MNSLNRNAIIGGIALAGLIVIMVMSAGCDDLGETACDSLSGEERDHCLQKFAAASGNTTMCREITGAGPASKCYALTALTNGYAFGCVYMKDHPGYGTRDSYSVSDCVMYVARNSNSPETCDYIGENFHGQATDLNPYMDVTRENCRKSIQCGQSGQPACNLLNNGQVGVKGMNWDYSCGEDRYTQQIICP